MNDSDQNGQKQSCDLCGGDLEGLQAEHSGVCSGCVSSVDAELSEAIVRRSKAVTEDGNPAIEIPGGGRIELRTIVKEWDYDSPRYGADVPMRTEVGADDAAWWTLYPERSDGPTGRDAFPEVVIEPTIHAPEDDEERPELRADGGTEQTEVESDRFDESHNLKYGVVKDSIPEEDVYRHDENPVVVYQFDEDGPYKLSVGSRVGQDTKIFFDSVYWHAGEYQGTLWFEREVGDEMITTGNIDWHAGHPTHKLGLVGEWFFERIDLAEYRAGVECPKCDGETLHLPMTSACDNPECDFSCEGHYGHAAAAVHSLAEYGGGESADAE